MEKSLTVVLLILFEFNEMESSVSQFYGITLQTGVRPHSSPSLLSQVLLGRVTVLLRCSLSNSCSQAVLWEGAQRGCLPSAVTSCLYSTSISA